LDFSVILTLHLATIQGMFDVHHVINLIPSHFGGFRNPGAQLGRTRRTEMQTWPDVNHSHLHGYV